MVRWSPEPALKRQRTTSSLKGSHTLKVMRLHIARGCLTTGDDQVEGRSCGVDMDPTVWSKMPDDILRQVMLRLPTIKWFQLQLVSKRWQGLLTSTEFRRMVKAASLEREDAAAVAGSGDQQQEQLVVAFVMRGRECRLNNFINPKMKMVKVDVSYVPRDTLTYKTTVVAAADGLVCVSSADPVCLDRHNHYVVNPLTRTWRVLPPLPFCVPATAVVQWLPSTTQVAVIAHYCLDLAIDVGKLTLEYFVATYDLTTGGGGGGRWSVAEGLMRMRHAPNSDRALGRCLAVPRMTLCGGRTFCYYCDRGVYVLEGRRVPRDVLQGRAPPTFVVQARVARMDAPSVELLGLQPLQQADAVEYFDNDVFLAAHRGAVFFVARLHKAYVAAGVVACVWRLASAATIEPVAMKWEPVALLEVEDVAWAIGTDRPWCVHMRLHVVAVCGVRELLCCTVRVELDCFFRTPQYIMLGFNLDTAQWELLHQWELVREDSEEDVPVDWDAHHGKDYPLAMGAVPLELRPDFFLL